MQRTGRAFRPSGDHLSTRIPHRQRPGLVAGLALIYTLLLIYGTLFPLEHWTTPGISPWELMLANARRHTAWGDLVTNLLVYIPLGLLLMRLRIRPRHCLVCRWALVVLAGALLSATLEYIQAWLPGRTPSLIDLGLNALGTGLGPVGWQEIEILADEQHAPVLHLHGRAAALAQSLGLTQWSLSLSHTRELAIAFVVAMR